MTPEELSDIIRSLPDDTVAIATVEGLKKTKIADLLNQPVDRLLYDLNRDDATNYTRLVNGDQRAINDIAVAKVLKYVIDRK